MRIFGKYVTSRQLILSATGLVLLASTTYDVHRSIKNNQTPPSQEQLQALQDYVNSHRRFP
ncbi:hypothetical protein Fmac_031193 [Flemingia macrophylla]|uniref:Uncharacterized protein n=1 Tax=Flemingia macrophylla TaxID=520843 RepID=A0ABD1L1D8_9FABA